MDNIDIVGSFSTVLGIVLVFVTVDDLHTKITISAVVLIVVLIANIIKLHIKWKKKYENIKKDYNETINNLEDEKKELIKKIEDAETRNSALVNQYKAKSEELIRVNRYWLYLNDTFKTAINGSAKSRFENAYHQYIEFSDRLGKCEEE